MTTCRDRYDSDNLNIHILFVVEGNTKVILELTMTIFVECH